MSKKTSVDSDSKPSALTIESKIELIRIAIKLMHYERERINDSMKKFNQYTSREKKTLWMLTMTECDRHYSELQYWLSALTLELSDDACQSG